MNIAWVVIFSIYVGWKVRGCRRASKVRCEAERANLDRTVPWPPGFGPRSESVVSRSEPMSGRR
jgi:hypothetical protein